MDGLQSPAAPLILPQVLVLADDLTGALEVAACFAANGLPAVVTTDVYSWPPDPNPGVPVIVVDTETRHLPGAAARRVVCQLASAARESGISWLFKKTDSTLRGNIAAELEGVVDAWPGAPIVYFPAYPAMGRTVRNGVLFVDGLPVSETAFATDILNPVTESHIPTLLRSTGLSLPVRCLQPEQVHDAVAAAVYVVGGETEEEMELCAGAFTCSRLKIAAGPSGFARYFAAFIDLPRGEPPVQPRVRDCLIINGSLHDSSLVQIRRAIQNGMPEVEPADVAQTLRESAWAVLKLPEIDARDSLDFARQLGFIMVRILKDAKPDAIMVVGGATAYGVLVALGRPLLWSLGEAAPGVPLASISVGTLSGTLPHRGRDLLMATKAGGFGSDDIVASIRARLTED